MGIEKICSRSKNDKLKSDFKDCSHISKEIVRKHGLHANFSRSMSVLGGIFNKCPASKLSSFLVLLCLISASLFIVSYLTLFNISSNVDALFCQLDKELSERLFLGFMSPIHFRLLL